jgi:ribulose-5-phosphate 4-epimerase/fuculose-1-phosphate aldolase
MPPALVSRADIVEIDLDCKSIASDAPRLNGERYIHCQIYEARSDVQSVIQTHDLAVIPSVLPASR